ncbi:MAG TPA: hypothetical protein VH597_04395 [Verrucomicrobiae bacterium]|nr:hypothetical protein [Verrucomicrobiae bacterium]
MSPLFLLIAFSLVLPPVYHVTLPRWMNWQAPVVAMAAVAIFWLSRIWPASKRAVAAVAIAIFSQLAVVHEASWFETDFKYNQTLKQLGASLRENYHTGDAVMCFGPLPEGLPFYSGGVISGTNRPVFARMNLTRLPFEFPGNQERMGGLLLSTDDAVVQFLAGNQRVLVVAMDRPPEAAQKALRNLPLHVVARSGNWDLLSNR